MTRFLLIALTTVGGFGSTAVAGGPPPVYVVVDKVVLEPSTDAPDRIKIHGSFVRLENAEGYKYGKPVEGYVYLSIAPGKEAASRAEWAKWQKTAGTGKVVAVGTCGEAGTLLTATIRKPGETVSKPDAAYTPEYLGRIGDVTVGRDGERTPPVRDLLAFVKERQSADRPARR
jgi:hypothetical protein